MGICKCKKRGRSKRRWLDSARSAAKTIKKNSTRNKSQTQRARAYPGPDLREKGLSGEEVHAQAH